MASVDSYITIGRTLLDTYVSCLARYRDQAIGSVSYPQEILFIRNNIESLKNTVYPELLDIILWEMLGALTGYYHPERPDREQLEQEFLYCIEPLPKELLETYKYRLQVLKEEFGKMDEYWDPEQGVWIRFDNLRGSIDTFFDPGSVGKNLKNPVTRTYMGLRPYWNLDHVMQAVFHFNRLYAEHVKKSQDPVNEAKQANEPFKKVADEIMENIKKLLALKRRYGPLGWFFNTGYDKKQVESIVAEIHKKVQELEHLLQKVLAPNTT